MHGKQNVRICQYIIIDSFVEFSFFAGVFDKKPTFVVTRLAAVPQKAIVNYD
jgi:hypothetical protein